MKWLAWGLFLIIVAGVLWLRKALSFLWDNTRYR
jgi:hypothetical protein